MATDLPSPATQQLLTFTVGYLLCLMTPGPNLMVLAGVAAARDPRGAVPLCLGVTAGALTLASLVFVTADLVPDGGGWDRASRAASGLLLLYIAWRLWNAGAPRPGPAARRGDFWIGFITSLLNPISAAFFASQFLVTRGSSAHDAAAFVVIGATVLIRSLLVVACIRAVKKRTRDWSGALRIAHAAGVLFSAAALWLVATAVSGPAIAPQSSAAQAARIGPAALEAKPHDASPRP
jgi:threonine/homoserine/homoserine lactone efflux protein